jgi:flagellar biosynthesis/type III secretory pathway protein FliH
LEEALPEDVMNEIKKVTFEEAQAIADEWRRTRASYQRALREGRAEGLAEGLAEGRLEGSRQALALVFELRNLQPTPAEQAKIDSCTDLDSLARWCQRAKTAGRVADIFD